MATFEWRWAPVSKSCGSKSILPDGGAEVISESPDNDTQSQPSPPSGSRLSCATMPRLSQSCSRKGSHSAVESSHTSAIFPVRVWTTRRRAASTTHEKNQPSHPVASFQGASAARRTQPHKVQHAIACPARHAPLGGKLGAVCAFRAASFAVNSPSSMKSHFAQRERLQHRQAPLGATERTAAGSQPALYCAYAKGRPLMRADPRPPGRGGRRWRPPKKSSVGQVRLWHAAQGVRGTRRPPHCAQDTAHGRPATADHQRRARGGPGSATRSAPLLVYTGMRC